MNATEVLQQLEVFWNIPTPINGVVEIPNVGRDDLANLFGFIGFDEGVEIGTEHGFYAETLCKANPDLRLICVDPYEAYRGYREHTSQEKLNNFYIEARNRLDKYGATIWRNRSEEAVHGIADDTLDFVYIDGNHSLKYVIDDICNWTPKVRSGGIVAGHDYISRKQSDYLMHVCQAVHAYASAYNIRPLYILGSKAIIDGEVRDKPRSWFFIKP